MSRTRAARIIGLAVLAFIVTIAATGVRGSDLTPVYETRTPSGNGIGKFYMGREIANVMSHYSMSRLDRPGRERDERTDLLVAALPVEDDDVVADIGAGTGYFSFRVAERVPNGVVYAVDIQQEMLDEIERRKNERGVDNIETLLGRVDDPGLGEQSADLIFIVDAYHEFSHPREMGEAMYKALRPGGHLIVVEERADRQAHLLAVVEADAVRTVDKHPQDAVFATEFHLQVRQFVAQSLDGRLEQFH